MGGLIFLIISAVLAGAVSGPIALILVTRLSRKVDSLIAGKTVTDTSQTDVASVATIQAVLKEEPSSLPEEQQLAATPLAESLPEEVTPPWDQRIEEIVVSVKSDLPFIDNSVHVANVTETALSKAEPDKVWEKLSLEQRIGTRWILVAGVITVFVGVCFLLKYAYDNFSLSPLNRVIAVVICGIAALVAGEITRRRGYDIVAKGVTALGFAILYAAIFAAYEFYGLIDFASAFILSIIVTGGAMLYAVILDEILIAFLSLLGGFLTPLIVLSKIVSPVYLFIYVVILSTGAMACAYYRKWRAVNVLSFVGTFLLYSMWFRNSAYISMIQQGQSLSPWQMFLVLGWLGVFFLIYLVMPIMYELVNKCQAHKEDVTLILSNATTTIYYLWLVLYTPHRKILALCAVCLSVIHLTMMAVSFKRCKEDVNLRTTFLAIGLFFATVALPLYFKMHALTMTWASEGVILAIIGLRYRSVWTQACAGVALLLGCGNLVVNLPMHAEGFRFIFNPDFAIWCFVAGAIFICYLIYRRATEITTQLRQTIAQICYAAAGLLLFTAATIEWYFHCKYNLIVPTNIHYIARGQLVIFAATMLFFAFKPVHPKLVLSEFLALVLLMAGSIFTILTLRHLHIQRFTIFVNLDFAMILVFVGAMVICYIKYKSIASGGEYRHDLISQFIYAAVGLLLFTAATIEWYFHCKYNLIVPTNIHYIARGQLVIFAATMLFFAFKPVHPKLVLSEFLALVLMIAGAVFTILTLWHLHLQCFTIFANLDFAMILVFIVAMVICHIKYRLTATGDDDRHGLTSQFIYATTTALLLLAIAAEWCWHCKYNLLSAADSPVALKGFVTIATLGILFFVIRPVCPRGIISMFMAGVLVWGGTIFTIVAFSKFYQESFVVFANTGFAIVLLFVAIIFAAAWLLVRNKEDSFNGRRFAIAFALTGVLALWVLLTEEIYLYWYCRDRFAGPSANWQFLAHMYISVMWALYGALLTVIGFWKNYRILRYLAIALFGLLLVKVFILDTRNIENVYRIAAFLATGITLVGVSYLYQFLRKQGFFDALLTDKSNDQ